MLGLHLFVERDPIALIAQAIPEIDVFDAWLRIARVVETAHVRERAVADGATTSPECLSVVTGLLMHEVVEQVLELRYEIWRIGRVVIRAEHGINVRRHERLDEVINSVSVNHHVCIDEEENVAGCRGRPRVSGMRGAAWVTVQTR